MEKKKTKRRQTEIKKINKENMQILQVMKFIVPTETFLYENY